MFRLTVSVDGKIEFETTQKTEKKILETLSERALAPTIVIARLRKFKVAEIVYSNGTRRFEIKKVEEAIKNKI